MRWTPLEQNVGLWLPARMAKTDRKPFPRPGYQAHTKFTSVKALKGFVRASIYARRLAFGF
jgi:hypothetical protein